jgi:hypothetical protein
VAGCAERHPGIEVRVSLEPSAQPDDVGRVELAMAKLHLTSVRGLPCGETMARAFRAAQPIATAHAHGGDGAPGDDPLASRIDVSVDLTQPTAQALATFRPPPGRWCGLELEVSPDEATATSLLVEARRGEATRRYLSASSRRVRVERLLLPLDQPLAHELHLLLDAGPVLASLEPAVNDARRDLLDTLLASIRWNTP